MDTFVVYANVTYPRQEVVVAKYALLGQAAFAILLTFFLSISHILSLWQMPWKDLQKGANRWRIFLALATFTYFSGNILVLTLSTVDWLNNTDVCYYLPQFVSFLFVIMKQFAGLVLWIRAKIVHDGLRLRSPFVKNLRILIFYSITVGITLGFGWSYWINYAGKVIPENVCVYYSKFPEIIVTFGTMDAVFNIAMLLLFIIPLTTHTRGIAGIVDEGRVSSKLQTIIRHNLGLSLFIAISDSLALTCMCVILTVVHGKYVAPDVEYLQIWAVFIITLETFFSIFALHCITLSWMPKRVRAIFKRSKVSLNISNNMSDALDGDDPLPSGLFLGNIHADRKANETLIRVRHYTVPSDTIMCRIVGPKIALRIATSRDRHIWKWRLGVASFLISITVVSILILNGILPPSLSWLVLVPILVIVFFDNNLSLGTIRLLFRRFAPVARIVTSLILSLLLFDVVKWDQRCALVVGLFLGVQYWVLSDAFMKESRRAYLPLIGIFAPAVPFWLLILLQFDLVSNRQNTILKFDLIQPYGYSIYLAARDVTFMLCVLMAYDAIRVIRGGAWSWFLFLNDDVPVRVVGLDARPRFKSDLSLQNFNADTAMRSPKSGRPILELIVPRGSVSNEQPRSTRSLNILQQLLPSSISGNHSLLRQNKPNETSIPNLENEGRGRNEALSRTGPSTSFRRVFVDEVELREQDSLVIGICGLSRGAWLLDMYTEPWVRLLNEYLLGVPITVFTAGVMPGFIHPNVSYILLLSVIPIVRNFGLKSGKLLRLLMFRLDFILELLLLSACVAFLMISFQDAKDVLPFYLIGFWWDIRTNDARCVFLHTGTRRGRRLSPFERVMFRFASVLVAASFLALPIVMFVGLSSNTAFYSGFSLNQSNQTYPAHLDVVIYYQSGLDQVWVVIWKLLFDVYVDLYQRGRGIRLRYIRAPISPIDDQTSKANSTSLGTKFAQEKQRLDDSPMPVYQFPVSNHESVKDAENITIELHARSSREEKVSTNDHVKSQSEERQASSYSKRIASIKPNEASSSNTHYSSTTPKTVIGVDELFPISAQTPISLQEENQQSASSSNRASSIVHPTD
jgi:hypothetical protein